MGSAEQALELVQVCSLTTEGWCGVVGEEMDAWPSKQKDFFRDRVPTRPRRQKSRTLRNLVQLPRDVVQISVVLILICRPPSTKSADISFMFKFQEG